MPGSSSAASRWYLVESVPGLEQFFGQHLVQGDPCPRREGCATLTFLLEVVSQWQHGH